MKCLFMLKFYSQWMVVMKNEILLLQNRTVLEAMDIMRLFQEMTRSIRIRVQVQDSTSRTQQQAQLGDYLHQVAGKIVKKSKNYSISRKKISVIKLNP